MSSKVKGCFACPDAENEKADTASNKKIRRRMEHSLANGKCSRFAVAARTSPALQQGSSGGAICTSEVSLQSLIANDIFPSSLKRIFMIEIAVQVFDLRRPWRKP